jgi:hypothetical protein
MRKQLITILKISIAVAGALLFLHLIARTGWREIAAALRDHWIFLVVITFVYTFYHLLRTWTLQICIPGATRFGNVFAIRLAGEAVAYIAVGSVIGDTLKVALGRGRIPVVESATGVFAEKIIYHLSGAVFIAGGLLVAVVKFGASRLLVYSIAVLTILIVATVMLMSSGAQPLAKMLRHVRARNPNLRAAVLKTETALFQFHREHPRKFWAVLALDLLSYFYSVGEVYAIYTLLGLPPSLPELWYYQSVVKAMNSAMMIVPANLGIFEATNVYLARQLDLGQDAGMIAALLVRIRATLWAGIGYLWFLFLLREKQTGIENRGL